MTTKQQVNNGFRLLRKAGYFAKQNFWCCRSCGLSAIPEDKSEKYVFYHNQDNDAWNRKSRTLDKKLYLAWNGDCEEICNILTSVGLSLEHHGGREKRIAILP